MSRAICAQSNQNKMYNDNYVNRIGVTGCAGKKEFALTFAE